nr:MFS transporter [Streptomyces sp. RPA4-2]
MLGALGAAAALLAAFAVIERRRPDALIPPRLFTTGQVAAGNLLMALLGSVWIALFYFLPLYQQQVLGSSPLATGAGQLPLAGANMLGATLAPRISRRIGGPAAVTAALLTEAAGLMWLSRISADGSYLADLLGPSILIGLGLSIAFVQLTALAVDGVPREDAKPGKRPGEHHPPGRRRHRPRRPGHPGRLRHRPRVHPAYFSSGSPHRRLPHRLRRRCRGPPRNSPPRAAPHPPHQSADGHHPHRASDPQPA